MEANIISSNETFSTSFQPPRARQRNILNDAAAMINNGGLGRPSSSRSTSSSPHPTAHDINSALDIYEGQFLPDQPRSLSGIAVRAFTLGITFISSLVATIYLLYTRNPLWRAPFFTTALSLFHFLEFYITALANTTDAKVSSFLLSSNGAAYTIAHTVAFTECVLSNFFLPRSYFVPPWFHNLTLALGMALVAAGQLCRSLAMYQAGTNFSHLVKHTKAPTHVLITTGIYDFLRHPSYFGFFWWGIGTQLVCDNVLSLVGFAVVLWVFFASRIRGEEESLIRFFGQEYRGYKARTSVGIPFIKD